MLEAHDSWPPESGPASASATGSSSSPSGTTSSGLSVGDCGIVREIVDRRQCDGHLGSRASRSRSIRT